MFLGKGADTAIPQVDAVAHDTGFTVSDGDQQLIELNRSAVERADSDSYPRG